MNYVLLAQVTQPTALEVPGLGPFMGQIGGYAMWTLGSAAVIAIIWAGIRMTAGSRGRSSMAADGLGSLPWIIGGLIIGTMAAALTNAVL